jgi:hypothetical protein
MPWSQQERKITVDDLTSYVSQLRQSTRLEKQEWVLRHVSRQVPFWAVTSAIFAGTILFGNEVVWPHLVGRGDAYRAMRAWALVHVLFASFTGNMRNRTAFTAHHSHVVVFSPPGVYICIKQQVSKFEAFERGVQALKKTVEDGSTRKRLLQIGKGLPHSFTMAKVEHMHINALLVNHAPGMRGGMGNMPTFMADKKKRMEKRANAASSSTLAKQNNRMAKIVV